MRFLVVVVGLLFGLGLAGCIGGGDVQQSTSTTDFEPCVHPWPCADGSDFPLELAGPFTLGQTLTDPIISHDGVALETTIYLPDLPDGVKAPVVLWSQPYTGGCAFNWWTSGEPCAQTSDSEYIYEGGYRIDVSNLVEYGFAVAIVNVRGTGNSGGCFTFGGLDEQNDQVHLVNDLAGRDWSNGRVAMYGHSYHGYTPWMAAIEAPEALKTVVASGLVTNAYTFYFTPQGAPLAIGGAFNAAMGGTLNNIPPLGGLLDGDVQHATVDHLPRYPERVCPEALENMVALGVDQFSGTRNAAYWEERRLDARFDDITTAVMVSHGFNDDTGHAFQDDVVWEALPDDIPKRFLFGQWGHDLPPPPELLADAPFGGDWERDTLFPWLDFWLKGHGDPAHLGIGRVDYQSRSDGGASMAWHEADAWPPAHAREEVLYLTGASLATTDGEGTRTVVTPSMAAAELCPTAGLDAAPMLVYASEPVDGPTLIAGNMMAYVGLESTAPRGHLVLDLWVGMDDCIAGADWLARGAASLAFHSGGYEAVDFPIAQAVPVRVDFFSEAARLGPGERLLLTATGQGGAGNIGGHGVGEPVYPALTLHSGSPDASSHLVVSVVEGGFGGSEPTVDYPERPFLPPA